MLMINELNKSGMFH